MAVAGPTGRTATHPVTPGRGTRGRPRRPARRPRTRPLSDAYLLALSDRERARLARRLAALAPARPAGPDPNSAQRQRRRLAVLVTGACLAMVPWMAMLAVTLPDRYVIEHWNATWVGFDVLLFASFAVTAWAAWRRRGQVLRAGVVVCATLLACDAWFDIGTASTAGDLVVSVVTAVAGELPFAAALVYAAHRLGRRRGGPARPVTGHG